jgi:hypothetical protein
MSRRVWVADCLDCGWQRTVDDKDRAEELRIAHEGVEFDRDPTWHSVERRWETVEEGA